MRSHINNFNKVLALSNGEELWVIPFKGKIGTLVNYIYIDFGVISNEGASIIFYRNKDDFENKKIYYSYSLAGNTADYNFYNFCVNLNTIDYRLNLDSFYNNYKTFIEEIQLYLEKDEKQVKNHLDLATSIIKPSKREIEKTTVLMEKISNILLIIKKWKNFYKNKINIINYLLPKSNETEKPKEIEIEKPKDIEKTIEKPIIKIDTSLKHNTRDLYNHSMTTITIKTLDGKIKLNPKNENRIVATCTHFYEDFCFNRAHFIEHYLKKAYKIKTTHTLYEPLMQYYNQSASAAGKGSEGNSLLDDSFAGDMSKGILNFCDRIYKNYIRKYFGLDKGNKYITFQAPFDYAMFEAMRSRCLRNIDYEFEAKKDYQGVNLDPSADDKKQKAVREKEYDKDTTLKHKEQTAARSLDRAAGKKSIKSQFRKTKAMFEAYTVEDFNNYISKFLADFLNFESLRAETYYDLAKITLGKFYTSGQTIPKNYVEIKTSENKSQEFDINGTKYYYLVPTDEYCRNIADEGAKGQNPFSDIITNAILYTVFAAGKEKPGTLTTHLGFHIASVPYKDKSDVIKTSGEGFISIRINFKSISFLNLKKYLGESVSLMSFVYDYIMPDNPIDIKKN